MEATVFTEILLPVSLVLIMFGMGMTLTLADFQRLLITPKTVTVGLVGQLIGLPLVAFGLALAFSLEPHIAIGLMILSACPGGTSSNLLSHIARANIALSVTLTAVTSVICIITTPWLIRFSIDYFAITPDETFSLIKTSLSLLVITLIPIGLGMLVRKFALNFAVRSENFFKHLSTLFLFSMIAIIAYKEREILWEAFPSIFMVTLSLNIIATALGILFAKISRLNAQDALTIGIEVGTQNATVAILIAVTFLAKPEYSIAGAVYGVGMYLGAFGLILLRKKSWLGFREKTIENKL
jgi:BASS family bile acid:Na+ symporter